MKKFFSLLLALTLLMCLFPAAAEEITPPLSDEEEAALEVPPEIIYTDLTVGNPTRMHGHFFTGLWGNSTSDVDVRDLLFGYGLVVWDGDMGIFRFDRSVISGAMVPDTRERNRSYCISLYEDLYYSDGTRITAWDYAFSVLFQCSPVIAELGGNPADYSYLVGFEEYISGQADCLAGLRVLSDNMLIFTVKAEALPYFYELSYMNFYPYPIHQIAPGCKVFDDGQGARLGDAEGGGNGKFSASLLRQTVLDPETGYLTHPSVVSGPYQLVSFDGLTAEFERNPYYKGNEDGITPTIRNLIYTLADNDTMIDLLVSGEFGLLNKVTLASTITQGLTVNGEETLVDFANYPRIGLTYLYFSPGSAAMQENAVRKAIVMCLDKETAVGQYAGVYGLSMDGLYGLGQWMYQLAEGTLAPPIDPELPAAEIEEATKEWEKINLDGLTRYELDTAQAAELLERAGWKLNEAGIRCKETESGLVTLDLTLALPKGSDMEALFNEHFLPYLTEAGIHVTLYPVDMNEVVDAHALHGLEDADIIYLGDNFNISFDPSLFFRAQDGAQGDTLAAAHSELNALALDMARTEPGDLLGYMQKWVAFQERFTDLIPMFPIYSNIYFDFYTPLLHDYEISNYPNWALAIIPASLYEDVEGEGEEDSDLLWDDDLIFFDD